MTEQMEVKQYCSRRNVKVGAPIVVLITKIVEASATTQNVIYICGNEHEFIITFLGRKHLLVCERCNKIVRLLMAKGVDEYEELAAL